MTCDAAHPCTVLHLQHDPFLWIALGLCALFFLYWLSMRADHARIRFEKEALRKEWAKLNERRLRLWELGLSAREDEVESDDLD